jgi:transglutaminase-like putative cysteine protease
MRYTVRHVSKVRYAAPVTQAQFNLRLMPWAWTGQRVEQRKLTLEPEPDLREDMAGPYCVNTTQLGYGAPLERLRVTSEFTVTITPRPDPGEGPSLVAVRREALGLRDLSVMAPVPYLFASRIAEPHVAIHEWAAAQLPASEPVIPSVRALMRAIHQQFTYSSGSTTTDTPPHAAFEARAGVCQDFAHVMIIGLRSVGVPAAYVSGYLRTLPPPGKPKLIGADAMHAWVNVWCGEALGWVGFDPTNDCLAGGDHIAIGMGRDYADVSPIDGTFIGSAPQTMSSAVDVTLVEDNVGA